MSLEDDDDDEEVNVDNLVNEAGQDFVDMANFDLDVDDEDDDDVQFNQEDFLRFQKELGEELGKQLPSDVKKQES